MNNIADAQTFQLSSNTGVGRLEIDNGPSGRGIDVANSDTNPILMYASEGTDYGFDPIECSVEEDGSLRLRCAASIADKFFDCGDSYLTFAFLKPSYYPCKCKELELTAVPLP